MKSDRSLRRVGPVEEEGDSLEALLELVDLPAALLAPSWEIERANASFELLVGAKALAGRKLSELVEGLADAPANDGVREEREVKLSNGRFVTLALTRRGGKVAVVARGLSAEVTGDTLAAAGRALVAQARVEQALLELGRNVAGATSEEELVAAVARGVKVLFPGRPFCVRITDQRTFALTSLYAEGRLKDGARDVLVLKRSAIGKTHLDTDTLPPDKVKVVDDEVPLVFTGTVRGICAPLAASGQLFGAINVEYPQGVPMELAADDRLLIQLANQVAVGVKNAKLIDELTFVRKYLEELLEHANALIVVANRDRRVVVFNGAIAALTGWSKQEVLGQDLLQFVPEAERMRFTRILATSLRGERVQSFETKLLGKTGREVRVSFATSSVNTAHGEVEGVIAIGQDLTVIQELERRVIQAEKLASLGQLAASVAHEINNPMTAVSTYADALLKRSALQKEADPGDLDKYRRILENAERVLRFTRDLVSYARPAQDRPEPVDVAVVMDMAVGFCDHVLRKHGVEVSKQYEPVPKISAVRANLVQVFVNLITNACQAMKPGGQVKLSACQESGDVVISVTDSGPGIPAADLERIFEPFFTTKPDGKGTGLGLSIVQGIVEKHGGVIDVDSQMGVGTVFRIRLPIGE